MFKFQNTKILFALILGSAFLLLSALVLAPKVSAGAISADYFPGQFAEAASLAKDCPGKDSPKGTPLTADNCKIVKYIITFINVLSALIGIVVVIMIVVGGIQYSASRDNPQATIAAKNRIIQALLALVFFLFTFAFLQWVVPGGVL